MGAFPAQLARMDSLRRRDYREHLRFYYGSQWPAQTINQKRRRLVFNYAKTIVEKVTSYLMAGRTLSVDPDGDSKAAQARARKAEDVLRLVEQEQDLDLLDFDSELDCAILGDAAYKVTWNPDGVGLAPALSQGENGRAPAAGAGRVRVTAPDVSGLYAWWQPDDLSRLWRVASQYSLDAQQISDLYGLTLDQRQPSEKLTEVWTERGFQLYLGARLLEERPNPYGFIPFVIYPNLRKPHQFWGESDITNVKESVQELNRAMSQLSAILEVSGNPIAVLENITEGKDIAVEPGAVWELPEGAKAYLLDLLAHGGMEVHLKYIDLVYRTLHDLGESPRTAFGGSASPNIAALAMQLDLDPIIKKVRRKQLIRTVAYRRRAELILRLTDQYTGSRHWPCRIRVNWAPVMPQDRARDAEVNAILVDRGIMARRTAAGIAGIPDEDGELERWLAENEAIAASGGYPGKPQPVNSRQAVEPQ